MACKSYVYLATANELEWRRFSAVSLLDFCPIDFVLIDDATLFIPSKLVMEDLDSHATYLRHILRLHTRSRSKGSQFGVLRRTHASDSRFGSEKYDLSREARNILEVK